MRFMVTVLKSAEKHVCPKAVVERSLRSCRTVMRRKMNEMREDKGLGRIKLSVSGLSLLSSLSSPFQDGGFNY